MNRQELEHRISELRSRPLLLLCRAQNGREQVMTVVECMEAGAVYIRLVCDDLDELLAAELGERIWQSDEINHSAKSQKNAEKRT